jgi:hypothetical protein
MLTRSVIIAVVGCAIILFASTQSLARRTKAPTTTTAPATRGSDKSAKPAPKTNTKTPSRYDDDDEPVDPRTGKARAQQYEKGKPVDKSKTKSQLDKLTGQVGSLEAALRNSGKTNSKAAAKVQEDEDEDLPAQRRKSGRPTTQPVTQPAKSVKSAKSRYAEYDDE